MNLAESLPEHQLPRERLLRHGADPRIRNKRGETAIDAARRRDLDEAADVMESWRHDG